jgi:hypothetical protein
MDEFKLAERVLGRVAGRGKEYREYFEKKLKKWNVSSPSEISDDKKDEFFEEVDAGWNSEDESGTDGKKKATVLMSLRDRRDKEAGCEKLPEGAMRDNCEKKKKDKSKDKEAGCEKLPEGAMRDNCEKKKKDKSKDKEASLKMAFSNIQLHVTFKNPMVAEQFFGKFKDKSGFNLIQKNKIVYGSVPFKNLNEISDTLISIYNIILKVTNTR